ncbi:MAG: beta-galactosidase [Clostridia bacterium]|nr:beta-galactosidase [Clostridia bacterium]
MKNKIISILLVIATIFTICPVCFADGSGCFVTSGMESKGSVALNEPICANGTIVFGGVHARGKEQLLTLKILDKTGKIYALAEVESVQDGRFHFDLELNADASGKELVAYIDGDDAGVQSSVNFVYDCQCGASRETLKQDVSVIEGLIASCEAENISVEYEKVNLGVIKKFDEFLDGYITRGLIAEYSHNLGVIVKLARETKETLQAYLDGAKTAKVAPVYQSSYLTQDGKSLIATMSLNGELVQQPVFLNGYGHWLDAISDYGVFPELGINFTHFEVGPNSILKPGTGGRKYDIDTDSVNWIKSVFKKAEDNNISIMFMTSMHYFPQFIYDNYPEINNSGNGTFPNFMPYNPTHPEVQEALATFLNAIIPEIKDYKSFHSICLANEPLFISHEYPDYYLPAYRSFLKEKYNNDISALRDAYGILFLTTTFDSITMPERISNSAHYNDWREFNDSILTQWFTALKNVVKKIDESIPVQTKVSAYISSVGSGNRRVFCGTNYEQWSQIMDLNGCDAWGIYGENSSKIQGKTMWYDFMTSLKNAPVINSEDHILADAYELTYNGDELKYNMADMWQGAIHGRAGAVYWLWDKSARAAENTGYYNANLTRRADHVAAIGKTNLDLNRLANEVTAIQKKESRTAVLYSNYTQVSKSEKHLAGMYEAYRYLQNSGEKVYIVNDTYPEKLNENENLELLVVPVCDYMPEKVWVELEKFVDSGKKIIFAESSSTYYNENGKSLDSTRKNKVLNQSVRVSFGGWNSINGVFSQCGDVQTAIANVISKLDRMIEVSSTNGETEWTAAKYGNSYVLNLCNFGSTATTITVTNKDGAFAGKLFDLIENQEIVNNFSLQPYETKLVRLDNIKEGISFWNQDGSEATEVKAGTITSKVNTVLEANSPYKHIVAVYGKDKSLQRVFFTKDTYADKDGKVFSALDVEISTTEADNCIIKSFLFDSFGKLTPLTSAEVLGQN